MDVETLENIIHYIPSIKNVLPVLCLPNQKHLNVQIAQERGRLEVNTNNFVSEQLYKS